MWKFAIIGILLLLMFGGLGSSSTTPSGPGPGPFPDVEETRELYKGYSIFVGQGPDPSIPKPWRWRVEDAAGDPVANATDWAATQDAASAAAKLFIDGLPASEPNPELPKPPVPTPDLPPKEGAGAPQPIACETRIRDGQYSICLYPSGNGRYAYRADDGSNIPVATEGGFPTKADAKVGAWKMLASMPTAVTSSTRHGVRIEPDSTLTLIDREAYMARAVPILTSELAKGERDPAGLVLAIFQSFWPSYNPLRFKPFGKTLADVSARVQPLIPNPQMIALEVWGPYTATGEQS